MWTKIILIIAAASISLNGWLLYKFQNNQSGETVPEKYSYLSKRILTANPNDIIINFIPLRNALREYVDSQRGTVGVYFEYLPSGISIGVNDREEIKIASLSKVPLVMSIYKKIERGQMSLNDVLEVKKEHLDNRFGLLWERGEGNRFSVKELIDFSLIDSDNTANNVLFGQLTPREINEVYEGLDVQITQDGSYSLVSPKSYFSIFRSLYLSSFLSKEHSNEILGIMTQTPWNNKIAAGVPTTIKVAHKIGVFQQIDGKDVYIDCGVVYIPERPYGLCVFVQDTDQKAQEHMSHLSKIVYGYIVKVKGNQ